MILTSFRRSALFHSITSNLLRISLMGFLAAAFASCSGLAWKPRSMDGVERWLPADTVAVVRLPNVAESRLRWSETAMGKGWSDPAVEYWRSLQFDPALETVLERAGLRDSLGILDLIENQAVLSLRLAALPEEKENPKELTVPNAGFFAIADFGRNAPKARALIEQNALGRERTPNDLKKIAPEILRHTEPFAPLAGGPEWELVSAWMGDTWVLSSSPQDLFDLLRRRHGIFQKGEDDRKKKSLRATEGWRKTKRFRLQKADALLYVDSERLSDIFLRAFERNMRLIGQPELGQKTRSVFNWLGLDNLQTLVKTVEIKGKGFLSRDAVLLKDDRAGLLIPPNTGIPIKTDKWMTQDVESFMALRMRPPLEVKKSLLAMLYSLMPEVKEQISLEESRFESATGVTLDSFLGALGSEVALVSRPSIGMPDSSLLLEIRDANLLDHSLKAFERALESSVEDLSYRGYHYQSHTIPSVPLIKIRTAQIDHFFMISTSDAWFKHFIDFRKHQEAVAKNPGLAAAPGAPGLQPLLRLLDEPFAKLSKEKTVVRRGYEDPKAAMIQMNMYLPLLRPMINLQLKMMDLPTIPSWVVSAIPPLLPFANEVFPTLTRSTAEERLIVTESYSAFDPLASPFAAAIFIIAQKALMESNGD